MAFVVAGFSKVFVGEIVEKGEPSRNPSLGSNQLNTSYSVAREVMEDWGDTGNIRPDHLREAHRRYKREHTSIPSNAYKKRMFIR